MVTLCLLLPAHAQESNALPTLEALVHQWVELRSATAAETRAAQDEQLHLRREIDILERECAELRAQVEAADALQQTEDEDLRAQEACRAQITTAFTELQPVITRAEADLNQWRVQLPEPLAASLAPEFELLSSTKAAPGDHTAQRLQSVIALYTRLEELQDNLHVVKQMLMDSDGARREMDVLYLGLARAFAVSPDGRWAAVGMPATDGWQWEPRPALAREVRQAVDLQLRGRPAELGSLPVKVKAVAP